ncbi:MAG: hypothetical protein KBA53_04380 [Thermoclostridium sp.]|nr:hypothetical protein [Thermoclostridium sp.]
MKNEGVTTFKVAAVYIGTIVGAGFATGQEVLQFFNRFGIWGLGGLAVATILFIVFGYIIMDLGRVLNARSHLEVIRYSGGNILGTFIDIVITIFLFGSLTAMIAGTGALFEQQLKLSPLLGSTFMVVITVLTVLTGIDGVINSISCVVPFLLTSVLGISAYSVINHSLNLEVIPVIQGHSGIVNHWLAAAVLYVSYNTVISVAVLGPLGMNARSKKAVWNGALLGGLGLGAGAMMIYMALASQSTQIENLEVPMIYIAGEIAPIIQILYAVILIAEIYTTAVGALFGFSSRVIGMQKKPRTGKILVVLTAAAALLASRLGFSILVRYLYPLVGYCGVALLGALVITTLKENKSLLL